MLLAVFMSVPLAHVVRQLRQRGGVDITTPWLFIPLSFAIAYGAGYVAAHDLILRAGDVATVALAILLGWIGMMAGLFLGGRVAITRWVSPSLDLRDAVPPRWLAVVLMILGLAASLIYFWRIGGLPLLMPGVEQARVDAAEAGGGVLRTLGTLLLPAAWIFTCRAAKITRERPLATFALGLAVTTQLMTGNRSLAIVAVIVAVMAALFVGGRHRLSAKGVGVLAGLALALVLVAGALGAYRYARSPEVWRADPGIGAAVTRGDWVGLTSKAIGSYVIVPARNLHLTMVAVPDILPYRFGYTWLQPMLTALPGHQNTFDADLKEALGQDYPGGGTVPGLVGEGWANFSWFGVIGWPFAVGLLLMVTHRVAKVLGTPAFWTLYAYALMHVSGGLVGGLFVASVFPFVAYAALGLSVFLATANKAHD